MSAPCIYAIFLIFGYSVFNHLCTSASSRSRARWQRFLTGDTQLRQQPAYGHHAQDNLESGLDDLGHHLARPQRKFKFELQGILLRYRFVNPFQFLVVQLWWTTKKRFRLQGAPATLAITRQPPKHRTIGYAQRPRHNRRSLARLDAANRPFPQSFQRLVIQPACVVFSHARNRVRTYQPCQGKYAFTYVLINTTTLRSSNRPSHPVSLKL